MTLYETIFARRTVRKMDPQPLDTETLDKVQAVLDGAEHLDGQTSRYEIVDNTVVGGGAPHYILAYCDANSAAYADVGFVLQKADLYLQSIGLGGWWLGMKKAEGGAQDFCIMLGFGKPQTPARKGEQEFKRLPLETVSDADNAVARAMRLAPSAVNSQPWEFHFGANMVTIKLHGRGAMRAVLKKRLNKIDLGIVTRYAQVALLEENREIQSMRPVEEGKSFRIEIAYK